MEKRTKRLLKKALLIYGNNITPCNNKTWGESVNEIGLWFNTANGSTHTVNENTGLKSKK